MPDKVSINLSPAYEFSLILTNEADSSQAIAVVLQPILRGEKGDPGDSVPRYAHTQSSASAVWTVPHNLNAKPSVMVTDHLGNQIFADVYFVDQNIVQVTHASAITGYVYCN